MTLVQNGLDLLAENNCIDISVFSVSIKLQLIVITVKVPTKKSVTINNS